MSKVDVAGIVVFSLLVLGLIVIRASGISAVRDIDEALLVLSAGALWFSFSLFVSDDGEPSRMRRIPREGATC